MQNRMSATRSDFPCLAGIVPPRPDILWETGCSRSSSSREGIEKSAKSNPGATKQADRMYSPQLFTA